MNRLCSCSLENNDEVLTHIRPYLQTFKTLCSKKLNSVYVQHTTFRLTVTLFAVVATDLITGVTRATESLSRRYVQAIMFAATFVRFQARSGIV